MSAITPQNLHPIGRRLTGRMFVSPAFDYLLIGGGMSLLVVAAVLPAGVELSSLTTWSIVLIFNSAHFAASTVRLYTKPGMLAARPFVTMGLPLVTLIVLTVAMAFAHLLGRHLQSLYLSWSPYHYAAQAYGLTVMYSYRSGCVIRPGDKRLLFWVCMLPFAYMMLAGRGVGVRWLIEIGYQLAGMPIVDGQIILMRYPMLGNIVTIAALCIAALTIVAPLVLFVRIARSSAGPMPLIGLLMMITNAAWWLVFTPLKAFMWATIFHGIQYLAIVIIFHLRDRRAVAGDHRSTLYHVVWFYGVCLLLGYALFQCLPLAYTAAGFGPVESLVLVVATINIHHFIVDGYIWRLNTTDSNRRIVDAAAPRTVDV